MVDPTWMMDDENPAAVDTTKGKKRNREESNVREKKVV
jgi:hypothetical protein